MYCFYKLNDKYAVESDRLKIDKWLKTKMDSITKNNALKNLFNRNGGGPNGSEWNPSTDLYFAIYQPSKKLNSNTKLLINGNSYTNKVEQKNKNFTWYIIPRKYWKQKIRKIDSADIKSMYSETYLKEINDGEFQPSALFRLW